MHPLSVHGYVEHDTDEDTNVVHEVKSSTTKKVTPASDDDYDEDPFFHSLMHNNDEEKKVVNVSSKSTSSGGEGLDEEMFEKFHERFFSHRGGDEKVCEKVKFGKHEVFEECFKFE